MSVKKSYVYKTYRNGVYLGNLPNVTSDFTYTWNINTAGAQLAITCGISADVTNMAPPYLTTEDGKIITTEDGKYLTVDGVAEVFGNDNDNILIRNGNKIVVVEYSSNNVNGKTMFQGTIERIEADFGGSSDQASSEEQVQLLVYSDGQDLNNYVVPGGDALFLDQSQTNDAGYDFAGAFWQSFVIGSGITNLAAITAKLSAVSVDANVTLYLFNAARPDLNFANAIATVTLLVSGATPTEYQFIFPTPLSVSPGQSLTFFLYDGTPNGGDTNFYTESDSTNSYAAGSTGFWARSGDTHLPLFVTIDNESLYFKTYHSDYTVDRTYTSEDPATMLTDFMGTYVSGGGLISLGEADLTGVTPTYTFSLSSILEAIQVCLALAPFGFYWYVDLGTDTLYFKQVSATADVTLIKGRHINGLALVLTTENIANLEYFSGGDTGGGVNLFKQYSDQASIQAFGLRLSRQSDNRVTLDGTADTLGAAFIDENKDEQYQTQVSITDDSMDTTTLKPGMTVGFSGFGTFIDGLLLQIVEIVYGPEQVTLTLGRIPPRTNQTLIDAARALIALQTVDNPSAPS